MIRRYKADVHDRLSLSGMLSVHKLLRWPRAVGRILRRANNLIVYCILFLGYAAARIIKEGRLFKL